MSFTRGWTRIRNEDRGGLWEHLVLDVLLASARADAIAFWMDKSNREVDFVVPRGKSVDAVECTIRPDRLEPRNLHAFRQHHPSGRNFVVAPGVRGPYEFRLGSHAVRAVGCGNLLAAFS